MKQLMSSLHLLGLIVSSSFFSVNTSSYNAGLRGCGHPAPILNQSMEMVFTFGQLPTKGSGHTASKRITNISIVKKRLGKSSRSGKSKG
ncbi:hypothetical protein [Aeromonas sp. 61P]|uniref:hypothetical protein n=1 Tax=Aeromonas sp. 61P TaxID=3452721 RepID=UPI003F7A87F8